MDTTLIVGGGIAGLGAAWELSRQRARVTVLEAKNRFGGRIHTVHHNSVPIDLGAEFIHGKNKSLLETIKSANLKTSKASAENKLFEAGHLRSVKLWDKLAKVNARIDPHSADQSYKEFLAGQKISAKDKRIAKGFVEGFHAAHIDEISAHSLLRADYSFEQIDGEWMGRINEGYGALIDFLIREIEANGGELIKNEAARQIVWSPGCVEIGTANGIREAQSAILTLPLGAWKTNEIKIDPPLTEKVDAIRELKMANVVKILLCFKEKWWRDAMHGFIHAFGEQFPTWWDDPRGPVLVGWAGGPKADKLAALPHDQIEELALHTLSRIFSTPIPKLRSQLEKSYVHNWAADPEIRGAYSYIPVNGLDLPKLLAAPVKDTLFFAGEATVVDGVTGTVFGALETGLRAAHEILAV